MGNSSSKSKADTVNDQTLNAEGVNDDEAANAEGVNDDEAANAEGVNDDEAANAEGVNDDEAANAEGVNDDEAANAEGVNDDEAANAEGVNDDEAANAEGVNDDEAANADGVNDAEAANADGVNDDEAANADGTDDGDIVIEEAVDEDAFWNVLVPFPMSAVMQERFPELARAFSLEIINVGKFHPDDRVRALFREYATTNREILSTPLSINNVLGKDGPFVGVADLFRDLAIHQQNSQSSASTSGALPLFNDDQLTALISFAAQLLVHGGELKLSECDDFDVSGFTELDCLNKTLDIAGEYLKEGADENIVIDEVAGLLRDIFSAYQSGDYRFDEYGALDTERFKILNHLEKGSISLLSFEKICSDLNQIENIVTEADNAIEVNNVTDGVDNVIEEEVAAVAAAIKFVEDIKNPTHFNHWLTLIIERITDREQLGYFNTQLNKALANSEALTAERDGLAAEISALQARIAELEEAASSTPGMSDSPSSDMPLNFNELVELPSFGLNFTVGKVDLYYFLTAAEQTVVDNILKAMFAIDNVMQTLTSDEMSASNIPAGQLFSPNKSKKAGYQELIKALKISLFALIDKVVLPSYPLELGVGDYNLEQWKSEFSLIADNMKNKLGFETADSLQNFLNRQFALLSEDGSEGARPEDGLLKDGEGNVLQRRIEPEEVPISVYMSAAVFKRHFPEFARVWLNAEEFGFSEEDLEALDGRHIADIAESSGASMPVNRDGAYTP